MTTGKDIYCLDANVLIEGWQKYYSPVICPSYWETLDNFGREGRIFLPRYVSDEINKTEDDLAKWLNASNIEIHEVSGNVTNCLAKIYAADPNHKFLVDNTKQRSLADPWVIAHAMSAGACVVTKENFETAANSKKVKIPNVCKNMGLRYINDFELLRELGIRFECSVVKL